MKQLIIAALTLTVSAATFAQTKKTDTAKAVKPKPQYDYFVKVPVQVYYQLINSIHDYRDILIYSPLNTSEQKLNNQAAIDKAMIGLKSLPIDSALIKKQ